MRRHRSSWRAWVGRVLLALASLVLSLAVCELVARVVLPPGQVVRTQPQTLPDRPYGSVAPKTEVRIAEVLAYGRTGRRLAPNVRTTIEVLRRDRELVVLETNSLGLRHEELEPKRPNEFRVLVLGDSVTLGCEVHDDELFTHRAERLVSDRSRQIRFINGGVVSMDVSNTFYQMLELLGPVEPDLVVIQLYLNDARKASVFVVDTVPPWLMRSRLLLWAVNQVDGWRQSLWFEVSGVDPDYDEWESEFVRHQRRVYGGDAETFGRIEPASREAAASDYGLGWNAAAWGEIEKVADTADTACAAHGLRLALMLSPVDLQVYGSRFDRVPQEHFDAMCRRLDLPCLDLLPALRSRRQRTSDEVLYDQCHLTPTGHQVVAEELVSFLDEERLIPR